MGRTSSNTDEKLVRAGVMLARKKGLKGFTVREVCSRSRVNLGMFHYYFKTRETFDAAVLGSLYGEMMQSITLNVQPHRSARENVAAILRAIYDFARKNRRLVSCLAGDAFSGDAQTLALVTRVCTRHVSVLLAELERARKQGRLRTACVRDAVLILVPQLVMAQGLLGLGERLGKRFPAPLYQLLRQVSGPEDSARRLDFLMNAVFKGNE